MSPNEYKQQTYTFFDALKTRLAKENIIPEIIQKRSMGDLDEVFIRIVNEVYVVRNDGNNSSWDFVGHIR